MDIVVDNMFSYDKAAKPSEETEQATFGLGCFWGPDATFGAMTGVVRTRVGYAGGEEPSPTYRAIKDHTEVVQVDYDPTVLSYEDLVEQALEMHNPRYTNKGKQQYDNIIFYQTTDEKATIEVLLDQRNLSVSEIGTRVEPLEAFYNAEAYHQKYNLRQHRGLKKQFLNEYDEAELRESAAAAKVNAIAAGELDAHEFQEEFSDIEFQETVLDRIVDRFR